MQILHLALASDWELARASGEYRISTRGATLDEVGFIHCSLPEQLPRVAAAIYADVSAELVVLTISADALARHNVEVRFEDGGTGEDFPHAYGAIPVDAVTDIHPAKMSEGVLLIG